jgi:hypothetical protein
MVTVGPRKIAALVGAVAFAGALVISHRVAGGTGLLVLVSIQVGVMLAILEARVALRRHINLRIRAITRAVGPSRSAELACPARRGKPEGRLQA